MRNLMVDDVVILTVPPVPNIVVKTTFLYIIHIEGKIATCLYGNAAKEPITVQLPITWLSLIPEKEETRLSKAGFSN